MIVKRWTEVSGVLLSYDLSQNQVRLFQLANEVTGMDEEAYVGGWSMMEAGWVEVVVDQWLPDEGYEDDGQLKGSFRYDFHFHR